MVLTYNGLSCFKLKTKSATLITDPFDPKDVGISLSPQEADIVVFSQFGEVSEKVQKKIKPSESRSESGNDILMINEPGEYEAGKIFVRSYGDPVFHVISVAGINICYLGLLNSSESEGAFDDLGTIDYLIVPVGDGDKFVDWKNLGKLIEQIDPAVVIPSCYKVSGMSKDYSAIKGLKEFLSEFGSGSEQEPEKKLKLEHISRGDEDKYEIVVLAHS